jgi:signal transduction histidine kinase
MTKTRGVALKATARPLILLPLLSTPVVQISLQWCLQQFTSLSAPSQWWLAGAGALVVGLLLFAVVERVRQRRGMKPLRQLASAIRQRTVNQQFHKPLELAPGTFTAELVDELNRLLRLVDRHRQQQQELIAELQQQVVTRSDALQDEINARKSAQEKLQTLARELDNRNRQLETSLRASQSADKAKAEFLANMSHEIRTPLNAVLGVASLLDRSPLNDRQRQQLGMIFESGKALLGILSDIMDYVRIEAGEIALDAFPFNLDDLIQTIMNRHREEALARGLHYEYSYAPGLPKLFLGDGARLQQLVNNIIDNAIKFTHEGFVEVQVSGVALQNRTYLICIDVQDTGIGIADELRENLFKVFSQGDGSSTRAYGGSGLGLAISSRLLRLMQGSLSLQTEVGAGSLFRIELPLTLYQEVAITEAALSSPHD